MTSSSSRAIWERAGEPNLRWQKCAPYYLRPWLKKLVTCASAWYNGTRPCGTGSSGRFGSLTSLRAEEDVSFTRRSTGAELQVRGTADRILELSSGEVRVSDYKTRPDTGNLLRSSWIRKGVALQIPLYVLAVGEEHPDGNVVGEALAVPLRPERDRDGRRAKKTTLSLKDAGEQALPAIDVLTRLIQAGAFPFRRDAHCSHCPYAVACRKAHPPSEDRVRSASAFREYFELHGDPD